MTPADVLAKAIDPALAMLSPLGVKSDDRARVWLLAIAGQEGDWRHRRQIGGPARSYWQGELTGGMILILNHPATRVAALKVCEALDVGEPNLGPWVKPSDRTVYEAIAWHDVLAAALARLLLYSDPAALPDVGQRDAGWAYYLRTWRPGAPHPEKWASCHDAALKAVRASPSQLKLGL